ncbi:hypothetical protein ACO2Q3_13130 [Caulobacter sp. KR2-114]|uniref:hypothetical protein n=1 Tax=Caulobacter sp. KR2-114 TaxID=3400912 RepID=UPI003C0E148F
MSTDHLRPLARPLDFERRYGSGLWLCGWFRDPDAPDRGYGQLAFTVFFFPVWLGRFYLVQRGAPGERSRILGSISGRDLIMRYGARVYWRLKAMAFVLPVVGAIAFFGLGIWADAHSGR